MASVFQKFGGIRPMAVKLGVPPSTVKSWHAKRHIPPWRHADILAAARRQRFDLTQAELDVITADDESQSAQAA